MPFNGGTSIEHELDLEGSCLDGTGYGVQFNVGVNNDCNLTEACGDRCILNVTQPNFVEMSDEDRAMAIQEILQGGRIVRHMAFVEKEPFMSPGILRDTLVAYHGMPKEERPQTLGAITNGLLLPKHYGWLSETPLDWTMVSLDGMPETHLRGLEFWRPAFQNLIRLRDSGGARMIGVNTTVTPESLDAGLGSVVQLGKTLERVGVPYWGIGQYQEMNLFSGSMEPTLSLGQTKRMLETLAKNFNGSSMEIVAEIDTRSFQYATGIDPYKSRAGPWRLEGMFEGIRVGTLNPENGRFIRLRYDGQLLDQPELLRGAPTSKIGAYTPGLIARVLDGIRENWHTHIGYVENPKVAVA